MALLDDVTQFAEEIRKDTPSDQVEVDALPSGVIMLHVVRDGRLFILDYLPSYKCFGVDEVLEGEGFGTGYRHGFPDFPSAKDKLLQLMKEPGNGKPV
jgi:hypothetical protein